MKPLIIFLFLLFSFCSYADCIITKNHFSDITVKCDDGSRDFIKKIPNGYRGTFKGKPLYLFKTFDTIKGSYGNQKIRFIKYSDQTKGDANLIMNDFGDTFGTILGKKIKCYRNAFEDIVCREK
jgi:hypothetical protein